MQICGSFDVYIVEEGDEECSPDCINKREVDNYYIREEVNALLAQKQDVLTKQDIIDLLGYKETLLSMETCDGTVSYHSVLAKEIPVVKTVLFTDGTFIINELSSDRAADVALHGAVTNVYPPLDESHPYEFDVFNVNTRPYWYAERTSITSVALGSEIHPTSLKDWFYGCSNLVTADLNSLDTSNVLSMGGTFRGCDTLVTLDLSSWDTSKVTDMEYTFYSCDALTTLDVSTWDTGNVTSMFGLFASCYALNNLDISNWDTGNVRSMANMFDRCKNLDALDLTGWDTSNVVTMGGMFYDCEALTSLDLSAWNTSEVEDMDYMFDYCDALATLNVSNWDTSKVTSMQAMFSSKALTSLDLSSFDTSLVENMKDMFRGANHLVTITVSNLFTTTNVTNSGYMFYHCYAIVGGNGTTYDGSHIDKEYARIDAPGTPGYFTEV